MRIRGVRELGKFGALCSLMLGGLSQTGCELPPGVAVYQSVDAEKEKEATPQKPAIEGCQPTLDLRLDSSVAELRSKVPVTLRLRGSDEGNAPGARPIRLELLSQGQPVKTLLDSPQGLESSDSAVTVPLLPDEIEGIQPGRYVLRASMGCPAAANPSTPASMEVDLFVVRLGATRVEVQAGDGERVPLAYHAVGGTSRNFYPLQATDPASALAVASGEPELDSSDGTPRAFPMPWSGLDSPPLDSKGAVLRTGVAFPVSLTVGTRPDLVFTVGRSGADADGKAIPTGLDTPRLPPIRLVLEGGEASDGTVTEGGKLTVRPSTTPVPSVSRYDTSLQWRFEAQDGEGLWHAIPGATQSATVRFYGVLGNEIGSSPPNLPWVTVVDAVTRRIGGATSDPAEIRATLVQHIYEESGLRYDRTRGASAYTGYQSPATYGGGVFDLTGFVARAEGSVINCADAASIVSTFANMVGARLRYAILLEDFPLNPVIGIGSSQPGSPFDSGNMGFKFHAVASHDTAETINDAVLAVDGDANPRVAPFSKRLVQNMSGSEYAQRLSPGNPEYRYVDQVTKVQ